jgi:Uncharacterised methyltransferase family (DUF6094)
VQGILVFVIPFEQLNDCASLLAAYFTRLTVFRMTDPESMCFRQIVLFGVRRNFRCRRKRQRDRDGTSVSAPGHARVGPSVWSRCHPDGCRHGFRYELRSAAIFPVRHRTEQKDKLVIGELIAGDIVGSALLLSSAPAEVDAVVMEPVRSMCWGVDTLERYLAANPDVRITVLRHLSRDLAGKIGLVPGSQ